MLMVFKLEITMTSLGPDAYSLGPKVCCRLVRALILEFLQVWILYLIVDGFVIYDRSDLA